MNRVDLIGRLTSDPTVRVTTGEKPVTITNFTVACQRKFAKNGQASADFIRCNAFGKTAENIEKFFHKGNRIALSGRITTGQYKDKDGKAVYTTDVTVEDFEFVESKAEASNTAPQAEAPEVPKAESDSAPSFMNVPDDVDDLPFA